MSEWDTGRYAKPADPYADHRCPCGHLVYADEPDHTQCRFCSCLDHARPQ